MADLRKDESWLEKELSAQLCTVSAPESLWRAIHEQRRPLRVRPIFRAEWAVGTVALVALAAALIWRSGVTRDPAPDLETLAARELRALTDGSEKADIRSADPGEIRAWIRERSDMNVRLPVPMPERSGPGKTVRLVGARMVRTDRRPVAVITYKVGDDFAAMLVADGGSSGPPHASPRFRSTGEVSLYSWSLGSDEYTIAFAAPQESQGACLLCHAIPPAVMLLR